MKDELLIINYELRTKNYEMRRTRARRSGSNDFIDPCGKGYGYGYGYMDMIFFLSLSFAKDVLSFPTRHHSSRIIWERREWLYGMISLGSHLMLGPTYILVPK